MRSLLTGRRTIAALLALSGLFASTSALAGRQNVGQEIYEELSKSEKVRVIVFLEIPRTDPTRMEILKGRVSQAQERVLGALGKNGGFTIKRRFQTVPAFAAEVTAWGLERLAAQPGVVRVDLDLPVEGSLAQSVPLIQADIVQTLGYTGQGVTVAVLDSGLDTDHPDLADDLIDETCFCSGVAGANGCCPNGLDTQSGAGSAEDGSGHGTNVTGVVTSGGIESPIGVAPDAGILAIKVLDDTQPIPVGVTSDVVAGLDWIAASRPDVDIVNMSLGILGNTLLPGNCDAFLADTMALGSAIDTLRANGVLSFASSGNQGSGALMTAPACIANAISVGAVYDADLGSQMIWGCSDPSTAADQVTCFSNSNSTTDLFAPGSAILSDHLFGGTSTFRGTSQAAPHAAACAANLLQAQPTLDPNTLETTLETTGVSVTDATNGLTFPRVDCLAALNDISPSSPAGRVPDGADVPGTPLDVTPAAGSDITLTWGASCTVTDTDYAIYEGTIGSYYSHDQIACTTAGATTLTITPGGANMYYLVVPRNADREGSYGTDSLGFQRPQGATTCLQQAITSCP